MRPSAAWRADIPALTDPFPALNTAPCRQGGTQAFEFTRQFYVRCLRPNQASTWPIREWAAI
jgi:hypothetical protein